MQRLPRPPAGLVRVIGVAAFSVSLLVLASANPLPTVSAPGGGQCAVMKDIPHLRGLWLGHFTGGRFHRVDKARVLDWRDQYSCFPSGAACHLWQRHLLRVYRQVQGYRTCMPLR